MSIWFIIELNFLCFVSILSYDFKNNNTNGNIYYFLIQSIGRVIILIRALNFLILRHKIFEFIFFIFLLLKLGGAPFQFWYLKLIQKIKWSNIWLISVWQKLIPLSLIKLVNFNYLIIFGVLRVILGSFSNLNQKKIKKILGLSSVFSLGWVLLSIIQRRVWLLFILRYGIILYILLLSLKRLDFQETLYLKTSDFSISFYFIFFLGILIIRGIPPFLMFYIKILIIIEVLHFRVLLIFILLVFRIFIIYIYLIIGFRMLTFFKNNYFFKSNYFNNSYVINYILYNLLLRIIFILIL